MPSKDRSPQDDKFGWPEDINVDVRLNFKRGNIPSLLKALAVSPETRQDVQVCPQCRATVPADELHQYAGIWVCRPCCKKHRALLDVDDDEEEDEDEDDE